jgi:hypothetical protein
MAEESTAAAPAAAAPAAPEKLVFKLSKPITAYGKEVLVLEMRKPTVKDIIEIGDPVKVSLDYDKFSTPEYDMDKMAAMICRLASIPTAALYEMSPRDLKGLCVVLAPFFYPA